MSEVHPVILCGGSGTRLWPLSRRSFPKQFTRIAGEETLFQSAALRLKPPFAAEPTIVTHSDFRFVVTEQLADLGLAPRAVLIEPSPRNTAPAILAAAIDLARDDAGALMLVMPSDHVVPDGDGFQSAVAAGLEDARNGKILVFGIQPTRPETGYGWIEVDNGAAQDAQTPLPLKRFVEKPNADRAAEMLAAGTYLWNAGIFLMSARTLIAAFERHAPEFLDPVRAAVENSAPDLSFTRLDPEGWDDLPDLSIDYAIMERADNLKVIPFPSGWSDLGDWQSVWREGKADESGNVTHGPVTGIDCVNTLLRSEDENLELVGIGLKDLSVVAMRDAVLVADTKRAQDVRLAVDRLKEQSSPQAVQFPVDHRPWGWFETLVLGDRFQVKRILVHPGASLSLQSHVHRAEHWIVVSGTAQVTVDGEEKLLSENESVYIPLGAVHRMANPGKVPMILIEVQTGSYLGEDDITRYDDVYARGQGAKG